MAAAINDRLVICTLACDSACFATRLQCSSLVRLIRLHLIRRVLALVAVIRVAGHAVTAAAHSPLPPRALLEHLRDLLLQQVDALAQVEVLLLQLSDVHGLQGSSRSRRGRMSQMDTQEALFL